MKIVVIGGCTEPSEEGCLKCCEVFEDCDRGNGVLKEDVLKEARRGPSVFAKAGSIWVLGGCTGPRKHLKSIEKINKNLESEIIEAELNEGGSCFAFCEVEVSKIFSKVLLLSFFKDSLFIAGGFNGLECLKSVCTFHPSELIKNTCFRLPTPLKNSAACQNPFQPNSVLLFGGWDEKRTLTSIFNISRNPVTDFTCSMDGILPYRVEGHTATLIDASVYLIGGYNGIAPISTIAKFDQNGTQVLPQQLEIARENHCTVFLRTKREIWIIGGWDGQKSLASIERFKVATDGSFEKLPNFSLQKARQKAGVVIID